MNSKQFHTEHMGIRNIQWHSGFATPRIAVEKKTVKTWRGQSEQERDEKIERCQPARRTPNKHECADQRGGWY